MSIIEKAVQRLDELKRAGVVVPDIESRVEVGAHTEPQIAKAPAGAPQATHTLDLRPKDARAVVAEAAGRSGVTSRKVDIDLERLRTNGMVTADAQRNQLADEFRVIKRPLISNAQGKGAAPVRNGNLIMITSALPSEGKSFTALNLAMSIAMELDNTVLLVDADVARPSLLNLLGLPPTKGLLDVLVDQQTDLSDVLMRTNVPKLSVLPAGTPHPKATELLASEGMTRLVEEMAMRYADRILIFDSPPLLVTTESRVLATHMGQIVMVVEAEKTTQGAVKQAVATIESCPVKMMVLNKGIGSGAGGYYGYSGYRYGYHSGGSEKH